MSLPATPRPPKDFKELDWQREYVISSRQKKASVPPTSTTSLAAGTKKNETPKTIVLPYYPEGSDKISRYLEVDIDPKFGVSAGKYRIKKSKPIIPGWLIELNERYLRGVMDIKSILEDNNELEEDEDQIPIDEFVSFLCRIINVDMGIPLADVEIFNVLKKIPMTCRGSFSFPHFMFALGNLQLASTKGILSLRERKFSSELEERFGAKGSCNCGGRKTPSQSGGDQKLGDEGEEGEEDDDTNKCFNAEDEEEEEDGVDETGYSLREKVFFSGLLIFEMYETLKQVECLYNMPRIPDTPGVESKKNSKRGFGVDDIGKRKMKGAAWDRPLPPLPKVSPYLSTIPFVTSRWNTVQPANPKLRLKKSLSRRQSLHLSIRPPRGWDNQIYVTENQNRVRQALSYLASKGDCVALLPDVHFVIHLSDTAVDKLEVITVRDPKPGEPIDTPTPNIAAEDHYILDGAKKLLRPYRLPCQISNLSHKICFTDGLQLREICAQLQKQHWDCLSQLKLEFRENVWARMRVNEVPYGKLRDSFIYAFVTYLPYVSHLPVVYGNPQDA